MKKINLGQKEIIHFVGIGGIGMSGLAQIMKNMGFKIQGSDQYKNKNISSCLKVGIKIFIGHHKGNIKNSTILILRYYEKELNIFLKTNLSGKKKINNLDVKVDNLDGADVRADIIRNLKLFIKRLKNM